MSPRHSEHTFLAPDGAKLFYRAWLPERPAERGLILLHRGHEHSGRLESVVRDLALPDVAVFAWDARGHGHTAGAPATRVSTLARDLDAFAGVIADEHGVPVDRLAVMGQSLGAVIAAAWVHDYAPQIRALILVTPAFRIRLYVPFALPLLRLVRRLWPRARVRSYVRARMLTHDGDEVARYERDPLITRDIEASLLLDAHDTSRRLIEDAGAIRVPTLVLAAGADRVVRLGAQRRFVERLGAARKAFEVCPGAYHGLLHDTGREPTIARVRQFILDGFDRPAPSASCAESNLDAYQALARPLGALSPRRLYFAVLAGVLKTVGRLSTGVRIGWRDGFDSGPSLDYIYRNTPSGWTVLGRWLDRTYLQSIGWRGIRTRKANVERALWSVIDRLESQGQPVRLLDVACGGGRYVLDVLSALPPGRVSAELRDVDPASLEAARALIQANGIRGVTFRQASAFDPVAFATTPLRPTLAVVSGLYELFPDNTAVRTSLGNIHGILAHGGYLIYTNQPWHPQLELIARVLVNREGQPWVMRCRSQAEMDALVRAAGFEKLGMAIDEWGIFTVSIARKAATGGRP